MPAGGPMSLFLAGSRWRLCRSSRSLMRDRPEDLGLAAYGDGRGIAAAPASDGNPLALAFRAFGDGRARATSG